MRYLPLVSSEIDPQAWAGTQDLELMWGTPLHPAWAGLVRAGIAIHAIHFPEMSWDNPLIETAAQALAARLAPDFLVFRAQAPNGRQGTASFIRVLTALLEATHSRGVKIALRPAAGAAGPLAALLKEIRGEAVGFCWDADLGSELESISDRLFCAVGRNGADLEPLLHLGYRWNLALEAKNPSAFHTQKAAFEAAFSPVLFPAELPTHALGRPVLPDEGLTFGQGFGSVKEIDSQSRMAPGERGKDAEGARSGSTQPEADAASRRPPSAPGGLAASRAPRGVRDLER